MIGARGLQALGYDVVCMEARQVSAALSAIRNKTDKNDARGIAQVVRSGWYQPVHMKSRESHYNRPGRDRRLHGLEGFESRLPLTLVLRIC